MGMGEGEKHQYERDLHVSDCWQGANWQLRYMPLTGNGNLDLSGLRLTL